MVQDAGGAGRRDAGVRSQTEAQEVDDLGAESSRGAAEAIFRIIQEDCFGGCAASQ